MATLIMIYSVLSIKLNKLKLVIGSSAEYQLFRIARIGSNLQL